MTARSLFCYSFNASGIPAPRLSDKVSETSGQVIRSPRASCPEVPDRCSYAMLVICQLLLGINEAGLLFTIQSYINRKREDVKSSFTSSLFPYNLFSVSLLSALHYVYIHREIVVSAPSLPGRRLGRANWVTFYLTVLHRLDGCCAYYSC